MDFGHRYAGRHPPTSSLGSLDNTLASEHTWGLSFSSYPGDTSYATNWKNPVIFLQHPTHLLPGDTILIETHVNVSTTTPHYIIRISYPTKPDTPPETIHLNMTSLYPDAYTNTEYTFPRLLKQFGVTKPNVRSCGLFGMCLQG